ncbi:hypothetical protein [Kordia sp.]|uniref:hypothetical protein n=1 Tax=Kordia sp. TaxID=1965332 RepID=UPI003B5C21BD
MKKKHVKALSLNKKSISSLQSILGGKLEGPFSPDSKDLPYDSNLQSECLRCRSNIRHGTCNDDTTPIETFTDTSKQPGTMCN